MGTLSTEMENFHLDLTSGLNIWQDLRFECHMTLFRSSEMSEELKQAIEGSASKINLGSATIKKISLRPRKVGKIEEPVLILTFGDEETVE